MASLRWFVFLVALVFPTCLCLDVNRFELTHVSPRDVVKRDVVSNLVFQAPDLVTNGPIIGVDTAYLTVSSSSTKWIGVNTEYLTGLLTYTESSQAITVTSEAIAAQTVSAAVDGASTGDVLLTLPPAMVSQLLDLAQSVCGGSSKRKRDTDSCAYEFVSQASDIPGFDVLDININSQDVANFLELAGEFTNEGANALLTGQKAKYAGVLVLIWLAWKEKNTIANVLKIPSSVIGPSATPVPTTISPGTTASTSSSSSSACPTGSNIPACADTQSCAGTSSTCASGQYKSCTCASTLPTMAHPIADSFLASQQDILGSIATLTATFVPGSSSSSSGICPSSSPTSPIPGCWGQPGCAYVLSGNGQGCIGVDYCNCGGTNVALLTTTVSGSTSKNCAYTTQPASNSCPSPTRSTASSATVQQGTTSCFGGNAPTITSASASSLVPVFCGGMALYDPGSYTVGPGSPTAVYHEFYIGGTTVLDMIYVTLVTTRPGCSTTTFNFQSSSALCESYMASITSACPSQGGILTSAGCLDWGISAKSASAPTS